MERYTTREGNEVRVRPEQLEQALARLAQFEDMAQGLDRGRRRLPKGWSSCAARAGKRPSSSGSCWPKS